MITQPMPFDEAIRHLLDKEQLPAEWDAATWREQEADFRTQAFFVSRVENARFLDRAQTLLFDYLTKVRETVVGPDGVERTALSVSDRSHFVERMRRFMIEEGMAKPEDFKDVDQKDITDIRSLARLNLIFDTNVRQSYGFGQWKQGMEPAVLRAFPAARLIRDRGVKVPRPRHQANLGEVLLKADPRWAEFHNARSIGGFGVPWGPYGFNSGVTQEDVSRKEAKALGLPVDTATRGMEKTPPITTGTQASTKKMDPELKKKLIRELRNGPKPRSPEEAARHAASQVGREMLNRGLTEAVTRGDTVRADKYRLEIARLNESGALPQGLAVREEGDAIRIGEDIGERIAKQLQRGAETDAEKRGLTEAILEKINRKSASGSAELQKGVLRPSLFGPELTLTQEETWILDAPYEIVVAYDPQGRVVKAVSDFEAEWSSVPQNLAPGSVFSHQHPGGRGPSAWDLDYLGRNPHLVSRIVTVNEAGKTEMFEITANPGASREDFELAVLFYKEAVASLGDTAPARREALELLSAEFPDTFLVKSRQL